MNLPELVEEYERRRAEAARHGSSAPVAKVYGVVLEELRQVDGTPEADRMVTTGEAAEVLGVCPRTVRRWIETDRFPGAVKTSGESGEWRIPARDVYQAAGAKPDPDPETSTPRLWSPDE